MKRLLLSIILGLSCTQFHAQKTELLECGTDELMRKHYERFPEQKAQDDAFNLELSKLIKSGKLASKINKNQVYEIPVVVHVVGDGSAIGTVNNKSDADIIAWINYTNGVFSGSSSSGMSSSSAILPVKFVFAKISPNCTTTNGINRINASHLPKYVSGGVNNDNTTNAVAASEITALGMWDTSKYYNIYVVKKLTSNSGGLNGFAYYPGGSNDYSFMSTSASAVNAQTLAHEFGHALGLRHTHEGFNDSTGACPTNTDCTLQGDLVCDTEPMKSLYHSSVPHTCQTGQINPCTSLTYAGGERNVMSYTYCFRDLFTPGQSDRATAQLLQYRQSLINSPVAGATTPNNAVSLTTACVPTTITNPGNFNIGITSVKFGSINNYSPNYKAAANNFYENFTGTYCLGVSKTTIPSGTSTSLTVAPGTSNPHIIKVYIDYNNDGQFNETTELVLNQSNIANGSTASASVTPPSNAVVNTALRMRVIGEYNGTAVTSCSTPKYGQVEDYSVIITPRTLATKNVTENQTVISQTENTVDIKSDIKITSLVIYDASGRMLVNQNNLKATELTIPINAKNIVVIVKATQENGKVITKKLKF
ncbi:GEVED domain-containing protein [Chryseobacterium paridis]|uniref:T9SS sorting signal type C domain-containing protein n=1 Tax=Chryseobacterium paridis TaxID=2800328 RepID=A0ABS1G065_9FLAO|nr:GEVED domain-containing protein [Chryseobacterium paridis]MBK1898057.1 T9SS sorting signal type C domain-containing protein [Chryseobacterium paridis]